MNSGSPIKWFSALLNLALILILTGSGSTAARSIRETQSTLDPAGPPETTSSYTLSDVYNRLQSGAAGTQSTFTEPSNAPGTGTMRTLNDIMSVAPAADNVNGATAANVAAGKKFWGLNANSGQWGFQTGTFVCPIGLTNCNGVCTNTSTDINNCGSCGSSCPAGRICVAGACALSCQAGLINCGGVCTNTSTDTNNCGSCGSSCPAGRICVAGACVLSCPAGLTTCDGGGTCTNLKTDTYNCGACGNFCPAGKTCVNGTCALSCPAGLTTCDGGGTCTNLNTDTYNCGACGNFCPAGKICVSGICTLSCQAGLTNCSGTCTNLNTDTNSCGSCGHSCGAGTGCRNGTCQ